MTLGPSTRLLLISTSSVYGSGYLDHAEAEIRDHLGTARRVLFVPYALANHEAYAERARERFERMGYGCDSIHNGDPAANVARADAIFIGGGNTFRLLKALYDNSLIEPIRKRVFAGMPYIGASAGTNVACPTIRTTNDMPIVEPPSLSALHLFPWQINPHYLDSNPSADNMVETREERLLQYLEENRTPVLGLREGSMVRVSRGEAWVKGIASVRLFRHGIAPIEIAPPSRLDL
jgi:dipeptidase E